MKFCNWFFSIAILLTLGSCKTKEFVPYYHNSVQKRNVNADSLQTMSRKVTERNLKGLYKGLSSTDSGKISIYVCINPIGELVYAEIIEEQTTITSRKAKKAYLKSVTEYRWESDRNAPPEECGVIKFMTKGPGEQELMPLLRKRSLNN